MVSSANTEVIRIVEQTLLLAQRRLSLKLLPPVAMVDSSQQRNTWIKIDHNHWYPISFGKSLNISKWEIIDHNDADVCTFEKSNNKMISASYSKEFLKQWLEGQQND